MIKYPISMFGLCCLRSMCSAGLALVEELDKRLLVQLRDGRKIVGVLRCA